MRSGGNASLAQALLGILETIQLSSLYTVGWDEDHADLPCTWDGAPPFAARVLPRTMASVLPYTRKYQLFTAAAVLGWHKHHYPCCCSHSSSLLQQSPELAVTLGCSWQASCATLLEKLRPWSLLPCVVRLCW